MFNKSFLLKLIWSLYSHQMSDIISVAQKKRAIHSSNEYEDLIEIALDIEEEIKLVVMHPNKTNIFL